MTFKLVILAASVAIARGSFINGGPNVVQGAISGSYGSSSNLLRSESGPGRYSSGYGYPLVPGRVFTPTVSSPVIIRSSGYGSPYPYGVRNLPSGGGLQNYQSGYGGRSGVSYPSGSPYSYSSSPNLRGSAYIAGYPHGGYNTGAYSNGGYSSSSGNLQNYVQQQIPYPTPSQINAHNNPHGSFNGLANGYNGY